MKWNKRAGMALLLFSSLIVGCASIAVLSEKMKKEIIGEDAMREAATTTATVATTTTVATTATDREQKAASEAERALQAVLQNVKNADNCQSELSLQLDAEVFGLSLAAGAGVKMQSLRQPLRTEADMKLELGILGSNELTAYGFQMPEQDTFRQVLVDGKKARVKSATEESLDKYNGLKLAEAFLEEVKAPEYKGVKEQNGHKYYVFTGIIDCEGQERILLENGSLELLVLLLENHNIAGTLGELLREKEERITELMKKAEDMEFTILVDAGTGCPVWCRTDVGYMLNDALGKLTGRNEEEKTPWSGLAVTRAEITMTFDGFNETTEPVIPESFYQTPGKTR